MANEVKTTLTHTKAKQLLKLFEAWMEEYREQQPMFWYVLKSVRIAINITVDQTEPV